MTNKELVKCIKSLQKGDMTVFDSIYFDTKNIVYYTVLAILKDPSLSEDIMQETYLKALEKIHTIKTFTSVKSWFTTIARNLAINEYNKRKKELSVDGLADDFMLGTSKSNVESNAMVHEILNTLNDTERDIMLYHVVGGLTFKEISGILNIPIGTVTWKYSKTIKELQSKFESR